MKLLIWREETADVVVPLLLRVTAKFGITAIGSARAHCRPFQVPSLYAEMAVLDQHRMDHAKERTRRHGEEVMPDHKMDQDHHASSEKDLLQSKDSLLPRSLIANGEPKCDLMLQPRLNRQPLKPVLHPHHDKRHLLSLHVPN